LRVSLYWLDRQTVGIGMHTGPPPDKRIRYEMKSKLSDLNLGEYRDNPGWAWLSEIKELKGQPQLTFESFEEFKSAKFAETVAIWVKQIANAYQEVLNEMDEYIS
jgi:hypothetical protein